MTAHQRPKNNLASLDAARLSSRQIKATPRQRGEPLDEFLLNDPRWIELPFSSFNLEIRPGSMLEQLLKSPLFLRLGHINQLQHLVPLGCQAGELARVPLFPHTRLTHSKIAAALGAALLQREGFCQSDQLLFAIAAAYHDAATLAYGDTAMRIDRPNLCEEKNFRQAISSAGLDRRWQFLGFKIGTAQEWIAGQGKFGPLLDVLDKLSYTLLDAYFLIKRGYAPKTLASLIEADPLFGDLWQSISIKEGKPCFQDASRLLRFLQVRAIMHDQLYKNPSCRKLELVYSRAINNLYQDGSLSRESLMSGTDAWLDGLIGPIDHGVIDRIRHRHFRSQETAEAYARQLNGRFIFTERLKPFSTGLDWLIADGKRTAPLKEAISRQQAESLERLSCRHTGWHTFFYD